MLLSAHVDFETRSALDLREVGLHRYARHDTTRPWMMSWAIGEDDVVTWFPPEPCPPRLRAHVEAGGHVVAHNAPFELEIWNCICVPQFGFPPLAPEQVSCTMVAALAMGLPASLDDAAGAMALPVGKDKEGHALMMRMARPRKRHDDGTFTWWDEPEKIIRLAAYCVQDVVVERELHRRLMPIGDAEQRVWLADYAINRRGVRFDRPTIEGAMRLIEQLKVEYDRRLGEITGGKVQSVSALAALKEWCGAHGVPVESVAKDELAALLKTLDDGPVKEALSIRAEAGKASLAKLDVMLEVATAEDRITGAYQMNGAGTGRWAGRKVQLHNLVRDVPSAEVVEDALRRFRDGDALGIDLIHGPPLTVLSQCLRPLLVPAPGHVLVGGDWSAIEGRGVAWFAGEEWKLDMFRKADRGEGPGAYETTASKILRKPVEEITKQERQKAGKVPELAFGYQGGVGAARAFGSKEPEAVIEGWKNAWRQEHPMTVRSWYALQRAAIDAVKNPGEVFAAGAPGRQVRFRVAGSFLWCRLPAGRVLCFPYPKLLDGVYGPQLTYMTVPSPDDRKKGRIIHDPNNTGKWARVGTYGGSLLENAVQALCADFLRDLLVWCESTGFPVVIHTHDDCYVEVPVERAEEARAAMQERMNTPPAWAKDFPLRADVEVTNRYGT